MSRDPQHGGDGEPDRRIAVWVDRFEQAWFSDGRGRFRIEQLTDQLPPADRGSIVAELLHVEMDLRRAAGQLLDRDEYERRFPNWLSAIETAWQRQLDRQSADDGPEDDLTVAVSREVPTSESGSRSGSDSRGFELTLLRQGRRCIEIPETLGDYEQLTPLGKGGFGLIYRAVQRSTGRPVALKFPRQKVIENQEYLEQFCDEARRLQRFDLPGVVSTLGLETEDGFLFMVQELMTGGDLEASIRNGPEKRLIATISTPEGNRILA